MAKEHNQLQDLFLNTLRKERIPVSVFLVNGIKLMAEESLQVRSLQDLHQSK